MPLSVKGAGTGASPSQNARRIPVKVVSPPLSLTGWATALEAAVVGEEDDFSVVQCYDADDTSSIEMICYTCRGLGHAGASCPSAKKMRTLDYAIGMLTKAKKMSEERAASQGDAKGGKRPLPRGQQTPFKAFPRRFQQKSNPHRRLIPAKAKSAEAEDEDDDEGFGYTEEEPEGAGSAMEVVESQAVSAVSREVTAVLERDGPRQRMPTAFSMDEHFETGQAVTVVEGGLAAVPAVQKEPLRAPAAQPTRQWPGLGFATIAILLAVGVAQMTDGGRTLLGWLGARRSGEGYRSRGRRDDAGGKRARTDCRAAPDPRWHPR